MHAHIATEQNYSLAQFNLGKMYEDGTGVERDLTEARRWYQLAAARGNPGSSCRV